MSCSIRRKSPIDVERAQPIAMRTLARALQVIGMIILPFAIATELAGKVGVGQSLLIAAGGFVLFQFGVWLQNRASNPL